MSARRVASPKAQAEDEEDEADEGGAVRCGGGGGSSLDSVCACFSTRAWRFSSFLICFLTSLKPVEAQLMRGFPQLEARFNPIHAGISAA